MMWKRIIFYVFKKIINWIRVFDSFFTRNNNVLFVINKCMVAKDNGREDWVRFSLS